MDIAIYTDGSALQTRLIGANAYDIYMGDEKIHSYSESRYFTTGNRMELLGVINSLEYISNTPFNSKNITVYTDSQYCLLGLTRMLADIPVTFSINKDLWKRLLDVVKLLPNLRCKWVKGHDNNIFNNNVDLAVTNESKKLHNEYKKTIYNSKMVCDYQLFIKEEKPDVVSKVLKLYKLDKNKLELNVRIINP
jgi:ribonuclease HI